ncbi:MAG: DEAD/DEAH box helicase [Planctomycetota bacterium]
MTSQIQVDSTLARFHACTQTWFAEAFAGPTKAQRRAWEPITKGESTLLLAPTGSGKTLAAFLASLDKLMFADHASSEAAKHSSTRVLYISPLKALGVDIDRNLRAPIAGIRSVAQRTNEPFHEPTVAVRSGDTSQKERREITRHPPEILITTPESLYLMLTSNAESVLASVETVIIDEIHVMVPTKRGVHLFLTLERLERLRRRGNPDVAPLQRIGLSATQRPLNEVARLLGGGEATFDAEEAVRPRAVQIVDASEPKQLELRIEVPVEDMARLGDRPVGTAGPTLPVDLAEGSEPTAPAAGSIWPLIHPQLVKLIRAHRSTMIFVNSRRLAERIAQAINEIVQDENPEAGEIALAHHGSIAKDKRAAIEDRLKRGTLPAIIATSSLELGIDMGAVDLVIQIEAPPTIASGLQRIGRAGHQVGAASHGVIFPKYRGDLLACSAATGRMLSGEVEETFYPRNPLDLLAQQIVAMVARETLDVDELYATIRGAAPYADLPRSSFEGVLDLLAGRYPSDEFAELRRRITWDRIAGTVAPRKGTQSLAILNGGTIPDRGLYGVFLVGDGPNGTGGSRVGELDEEMVFETHAGEVFLLGASSWRVLEITRDRVLVAPAPGEPGRMPFWRGDAPGRPLEFGRAIGRLARELSSVDEDSARSTLQNHHALDQRAADNLLQYLADQRDATDETPSDRAIVIESFIDEIGDWRVCVLSPFGARVHAPWAMAVAAKLREEELGEVDMNWSDDGMVFRLPESDSPPTVDRFLPSSEDVEDMVTRQLGSTALFAARFRENAARALLLPKRRPQGRTPLWMQRRKSADLLQVASRYPKFPILLETYRECLRDVFDLPGLVSLLRDIERRAVRVISTQTASPSPFASSLLFNYTANFLYEGDAPLAERRAAALALDHTQLRELLGSADLSDLLDGDTIDQLSIELARLDRPAVSDADQVHDLLQLLGDLSGDELFARCDSEAINRATLDTWINELLATRRIINVRIGGENRLAAAEDAARFRDALGSNPPPGLPTAFLEQVADPLGDLVSRFARTHGPFTADEAALRLGLGEAPVMMALEKLEQSGRVVSGSFTTARGSGQWCDTTVLRQIKRRSLAKLRQQVEAAPPESLARFLPIWQGVTQPRRGLDGLLDVIEQLQGTPMVGSELETEILPARLQNFLPSDLDELFLAGEIIWRGIESVGVNDGRIAVFLTDQYPLLAPPIIATDDDLPDPTGEQLRELLGERGALRFDEIVTATNGFPNDLLNTLWRLVWQGEVTNDTLAPLRSLQKGADDHPRRRPGRDRRRPGGRTQRFRSRRTSRLPGSEGRWSLLPVTSSHTPTEKQTALVTQLLERYGVFTRGMVTREVTVGGFAALYPVLKAMEEAGRARRGYFVEGLGGAQFACAGADDMLRSSPDGDRENPIVIAANDPANAYGAALPWPAQSNTPINTELAESSENEAMRPQRAAGALVVLAAGRLLGYLGRTRTKLTTFLAENEPDRSRQQKLLATALAQRAKDRQPLILEQIDGTSPDRSSLGEALATEGFKATSRGYVHRG